DERLTLVHDEQRGLEWGGPELRQMGGEHRRILLKQPLDAQRPMPPQMILEQRVGKADAAGLETGVLQFAFDFEKPVRRRHPRHLVPAQPQPCAIGVPIEPAMTAMEERSMEVERPDDEAIIAHGAATKVA